MFVIGKKQSFGFLLPVTTLLLAIFHWFYTTIPSFSGPMISSEDGYSRLASGVAWSSPITRYPINYVWPPLTPIFYSIAHLVQPTQHYLSIRWSAWVLILLTTAIIGLIGYRLSKNIAIGILSLALALTNPLLINLSTQTLSENIWLPLVGMAIFFIIGHNQKQWLWGVFFWTLSQTVRYESWYLSPLLIVIFWILHRHRRSTIIFIISSLIFPVYWYLQTSLSTNNFHFYLDEKLLQAKHGPPNIYYHLLPSIGVWTKQLLNTLTPPVLLVFLLGSHALYRRHNHIYLIPIFIFFSLIAQVYFATMEIFPGRYLCLLPLFAIPISINYLFNNTHLSRKSIYIIMLSITLLDIISAKPRILSLKDKVHSDQIEVGNYISSTTSPCVVYLKSNTSPRFDHSAFWYFSQLQMTNIKFQRVNNPFIDSKIPSNCFVVVVEKIPNNPYKKEDIPQFYGVPVFENTYFQVYEPPLIKNRIQNVKK